MTTIPRASARPPCVRELPLIGSSIPLLNDTLGFLERATAQHGDAFRFHIPGQHIFVFNHPDAIEQVLVTERSRLMKDKPTTVKRAMSRPFAPRARRRAVRCPLAAGSGRTSRGSIPSRPR